MPLSGEAKREHQKLIRQRRKAAERETKMTFTQRLEQQRQAAKRWFTDAT